MRALALIATCCCVVYTSAVTQYIVDSTNGDDSNNGLDTDNAFATILRCVFALRVSELGSECLIRAGRYHEEICINDLNGTADNPYIIKGYGDERPIWDGTVLIQSDQWDYDENTGICSTAIDQDIFALFLDDNLMTAARWPNALWSDRSVFYNDYWGHCSNNSVYGHLIDDGTAGLANSGINATGVMGILNIGSFMTYVQPILHHEPGTSNFTYDHTPIGDIHWKSDKLQYYLEAGLELLDAPEEWYFDKDTQILYFIPPSGSCPEPDSTSLRGRTVDFGLEITNTVGLTIANITFLGSGIHAYTLDYSDLPNEDITLDSVQFKFPSSSHRMLGITEEPAKMRIMADAKTADGDTKWGRISIINCTVEGSEGEALVYAGGEGSYIHNNLFLWNDWTGQDSEIGGGGTVLSNSTGEVFSHNTFYNNGNSAGFRPGLNATVEYNRFVGQCLGWLQNDGAAVQVQIPQQDGIHLSHNWVYDSPKQSLRFDTPNVTENGKYMGYNGYVGYNVQWNTDLLMVKGDNHTVENNFALSQYYPGKSSLVVLYRFNKDPTIENNNTITVNNAATKADGGNNADGPGRWPLQGAVVENNYSNEDVNTHLVDPFNLDFRPIENGLFANGTDIIGPYTPGSDYLTYWIPGQRLYKTSMPVPKDGSNVSHARDVVMCLEGYEAEQLHFYLGTDNLLVENASMDDEEFHYLLNEGNIFHLPTLMKETTYYWRVDTKRKNYTYKGDTWKFTTSSD